MKRKKLTAFVMAALLGVSALAAGCGGTEETADDPKTGGEGTAADVSADDPFAETVDLSIGFWGCDKLGNDEFWNDYLVPKFNIDFEFVQMSFSDYAEKVRLLAASGDLPNICVNPDRNDYFNFAEQGLLKPLPEDLSMYPNLQAYLDTPSLPYYYVDGQLYGIPRGGSRDLNNSFAGSFYMVRKDWMEAAGYDKMPDTWEGFFEMVRKIMDVNPEKIPNLIGIAGSTTEILEPVQSSLSSIGEGFQQVDGKWQPAEFNKEDNIGWLKLMRKAYQQGVFDKDFALNDASVAKDKILAGQAVCGMLYMTAADMQGLCEQFETANPGKSAEDCIGFFLPPNSYDGKPHAIYSTVSIGTFFSADTTDEQMDRALRLIDWMLSDEGQTAMALGIEGKDYELDADGNYVNLLPVNEETGVQYTFEEKNPSSVIRQLVTWGGDWAKISPTVDKRYRDIYNEAEEYVMNNAVFSEYQYEVAWTNTPAMAKWNYKSDFSQGFVKIIVGTDDIEKMYDEIIAGTLAKGGEQALQELNEALAE